jgi:hypothetical protein
MSSGDFRRYRFPPPPGAREMRLVSRTFVPSEQRPWVEDGRRLGVMVRHLTLRAGTAEAIPLDHRCLDDGWWDLEGDGRQTWRWTNGAALLKLPVAGSSVLEVEISGQMTSPVAREVPTTRALGRRAA